MISVGSSTPAIGIDQEARKAREQRRRAERAREMLGHARGADIIGDVAAEVFRRKPSVP